MSTVAFAPERSPFLWLVEREILRKTLTLADGNQSQAARMLGMHESTLRFRMRRAGIAPPKRATARKSSRPS